MPLYEYRCRSCGLEFEALILLKAIPVCPTCGSHEMERLVSAFGVSSEGTRQSSIEGARKRALRVRRDQIVADAEYKEKHRH